MKWLVTTRATVRREYEVEAADQQEAERKFWPTLPTAEEEIEEETESVLPMQAIGGHHDDR